MRCSGPSRIAGVVVVASLRFGCVGCAGCSTVARSSLTACLDSFGGLDGVRSWGTEGDCWIKHGKRAAGDCERAIALYSEALRIAPGCADAYQGRGTCWLEVADYAAAADDFTAAIEIDPVSYCYGSRSLAHYAMGEYRAAIADIDAALENERLLPADDIARLYFTRGMAWKALGQTAHADANLARAREFEIGGSFDPEQ